MDVTIEDHDLEAVAGGDLRAVADVERACDAHALPEHPVLPAEELVAWYGKQVVTQVVRLSLARDGGAVVGFGVYAHGRGPDNPTHCHLDVMVGPEHRRAGVGTALLRPLIATARANGRTLLNFATRRLGDGPAMLGSIGAEERYVEHRNVLFLDRIPEGLLEEWVARAPERAEGYRLLTIDAPTPDQWVEPYCALLDVMNTAPREGLECDDEHATPEEFRAKEEKALASGAGRWTLAVIGPDGDLAGFTELYVPAHARDLMYQANTGVWPAHRNRGLGRWLKAAMLLRLREERPEVSRVETWNAGSNEPMLAINHQLGFRLLEEIGEWQVPLATVEGWLASR